MTDIKDVLNSMFPRVEAAIQAGDTDRARRMLEGVERTLDYLGTT